jgi:sulfite reductase alpha subunit-like flavoprotein
MKLTLGQIVTLFEELNGRLLNRETGERSKGVLSHKLSIRAKYLLNTELNKAVAEEVKSYEEARLEIFKDLGKQEGESYVVAPENQEELIKRIQELESIEKTITVPKLKVEELFSIETDDYFPILLEVLLGKKEEAKAEPTAAVEEATVVPMS